MKEADEMIISRVLTVSVMLMPFWWTGTRTGFFAGIVFIIVLLLILDKLVFSRREEMNLF